MNNFVVVVLGPTASGKSGLAIELAKKLNGEIVGADSMQIYSGMDIATAKPTKEEMQQIPHHLIGVVPQNESFSVAKFKPIAIYFIDDILQRGKLPIVCGGTGLYIDALINNTVFVENQSGEFRNKLKKQLEEEGIEALYENLKQVDPEEAAKLSLSDTRRIIRALEMYYSSGLTKTQQNELSHLEKSKYHFVLIGLNYKNRALLYDRINRRIDIMLEEGLIEEIKEVYQNNNNSKTSAQAIGYKELIPYFSHQSSLEECVEQLKMNTRRYAKRQLTWFRRYQNVNWIYPDESDSVINEALNIIKKEV